MTARRPAPPGEINPYFSYPINSPTAVAVIGLAPSQQKEAWERGELPVPPKLTARGRRAYLGKQLIEIQEQRAARAKAEAEQLQAARSRSR